MKTARGASFRHRGRVTHPPISPPQQPASSVKLSQILSTSRPYTSEARMDFVRSTPADPPRGSVSHHFTVPEHGGRKYTNGTTAFRIANRAYRSLPREHDERGNRRRTPHRKAASCTGSRRCISRLRQAATRKQTVPVRKNHQRETKKADDFIEIRAATACLRTNPGSRSIPGQDPGTRTESGHRGRRRHGYSPAKWNPIAPPVPTAISGSRQPTSGNRQPDTPA